MFDAKMLSREAEGFTIDVRRHLHQNPELSGAEYRTADYLEEKLKSFSGLTVTRPCKTGVAAVLQGAEPGRVYAARCDIDALALEEADDSPFRSRNPGVMHACGHDGNTAVLLTVAKILSEHRNMVKGTIKFIFQPSEEVSGGGSSEIIESGIVDDVDVMLAAHVRADTDVGVIRIENGETHAAVYGIRIVVHGRGGHGGFPYQCTDNVMVAAEIVCALNSVIAKDINPIKRAVFTITQFEAANANNIIPEYVTLGGTLRVLDEDAEQVILRRIKQLCNGIAAAYDVECTVDMTKEYGVVRNDDAITNCVRRIVQASLGAEHVTGDTPVMGGEDFCNYLAKCKNSCYFQIGTKGLGDGVEYPHHHPRFCLNEAGLRYGVQAWLSILTEL